MLPRASSATPSCVDERGRVGTGEAEREDQRVDRDPDLGCRASSIRARRRSVVSAPSLALEARRAERERALAAFLLRARGAEHERPRRPRVGRRAVGRRRGHQLDLRDRARRPGGCAVPRQSEPVSPPPRITTRLPRTSWCAAGALAADDLVLLGEVVHREHDARELAARARRGRARAARRSRSRPRRGRRAAASTSDRRRP